MEKRDMASYEELYEEIRLKNSLLVEGLAFEPDIFSGLEGLGTKYTEGIQGMFSQDKEAHREFVFPACFFSPKGGFLVRVRWNRTSKYILKNDGGQYNIYEKGAGEPILENLHFKTRSAYYERQTSDGTYMKTVAQDNGYGVIFICYSNECSLKDKGLDCLFCNINATKAIYGEVQGIAWKTPGQIGETVRSAYGDGFSHLTVSGGFVPERREVEYYLDVAENICDTLEAESFNGTACVGAPTDFSVFEKYRDAGFSTIATNMEVWDNNLFPYYCPGKSKQCGGHENWLNALKEELQVFGKHKVRTTFVAGLETKESLLTGIEYLAGLGVIPVASQWYVNVGSALEGHRTPQDDWHFEVQERTADIYIKNGVTWEELRNATAESDSVAHDLFRLKRDVRIDGDGKILDGQGLSEK